MGLNPIAIQRLHNQRITQPGPAKPADLVAWLGAVQAQDYGAATWALGLRMPEGATHSDVESAIDAGHLIRTHVMRPTWHVVAADDVGWMLELTAPRVHRALAYGHRQLELDLALRTRATAVFERALRGGDHLTRAELGVCLARAGIAAKGVRLALLTVHAELERVICSGRKRGAQLTYALLADRVRRAKRLSPDEALAELTTRYFRSHAPATIRDFGWWSGLTTSEVKRGLDITGARSEVIDGHTYWMLESAPTSGRPGALVHLIPIYDEYLVAYRDHHAVPRRPASHGILPQALLAGGQVAGTWKAVRNAGGLVVEVTPGRPLTGRERRALTTAGARYGRFLKTTLSIKIRDGVS